MADKKAAPDRREIDFNRILRNRRREPHRTMTGAVLRLGQITVEALDASRTTHKGEVDAVEKQKREALGGAIVNVGLGNGSVESSAPFNVLSLPDRLVKVIDKCIDDGANTGQYASARRLLFPDDEQATFDDIELVRTPSLDDIEEDDGAVAEVSADDEEGDDETEG